MRDQVVVTGAGGTVGLELPAAIAEVGLYSVPLKHADLDVTDRVRVQATIGEIEPLAVVHLAANTNLDVCEQQREQAVAVNVMGTEHIAAACREAEALCVYVSTGGVFGGHGSDGPFHELDVTRPANWYATTKLAGEAAVTRARRWTVVRAGWIVGGGVDDPKFVGKMLRAMQTNSRVSAVVDRLGTLTFASELARFLAGVVAKQVEGLWHYASEGVVSRYDIALELTRSTGLEVEVEPVPHTNFPSPAPRGRSEAITSVRPLGELPRPSDWRSGLSEYVKAMSSSGRNAPRSR